MDAAKTLLPPIARESYQRLAAIPWATAAMLVACFAVQVSHGLDCLIQFDRSAVAAGETWRMLTCHLSHWSWDHLFWDAVVFAGLGAWLERDDRRRFIGLVAAAAAAISAGVWFWQPEMATYRGLSGVDTALFTAVALRLLIEKLQARDWRSVGVAGLLLCGFVAKTVLEATIGRGLFVDVASAGFEPAPLAHLIGAAVGAAFAAPALLASLRQFAGGPQLSLVR